MQFPQRDLTQQYISTSYQDVVQRYATTGSTTYLLDGLGYVIAGIPTASIGNNILTQDQTASWAGTASYAISSSVTYTTSSLVSVTSASWASQSLSSSYTSIASSASTALNANQSNTSNYATFAEMSDTSSFTTYSNTSGLSISSSYANIASLSLVSDVALLADTASLADIAYSSISSSWASQSLSASWAPSSGGGTTLFTASTYQITSSWAVSASWAPGGGASVSSSWASSSISSSYSLNADSASAVYISASQGNRNYPIVLSSTTAAGIQILVADDDGDMTYNPSTDTLLFTGQGGINITGTGTLFSTRITASRAVVIGPGPDHSASLHISGSPNFNIIETDVSTQGSVPNNPFVVSSVGVTYITTGSLTGSLLGTASNAVSASYTPYSDSAISSSYSINSDTASYVTSSNIDGGVANIQINESNTGIWYPVFVQSDTSPQSLYIDENNGMRYNMDSFTLNVDNLGVNDETITNNLTVYNALELSSSNNSYALEVLGAPTNSFVEINVQNSSRGPSGSADHVATNNLGNENAYYVDMGINNSNYVGYLGYGSDAYIFNTGNGSSSLYVGATDTSGSLYLYAGGTNNTSSITISPNGTVGINQPNPVNALDIIGNISCSIITASLFTGTSTSASYLNPGATFYQVSGSNGVQPAFIEPYDYCPSSNNYLPPYKAGRMWYDNRYIDWAYYPNTGSNATSFRLHLGKEVTIGVHNPYSVTLPRLSAVYIGTSSVIGAYQPDVYLAIADGTGQHASVEGVIRNDIPSGSTGFMLMNGVMHRTDMGSLTVGQQMWLSNTTPGAYQTTEPSPPYEQVFLGYCSEAGPTGSFVCSINKLPPIFNPYAGTTTPITVTNNNNGTITISSGSCNLFADSTGEGLVTEYLLPQTTLAVIPGYLNDIVTIHSGSTAVYFNTLNPYIIDGLSVIPVAKLNVQLNGSNWYIQILNVGITGLAVANELSFKDTFLSQFQRQSGLTLFTTGSSNDFGITAGDVWFGTTQHLIGQFDSFNTASCNTFHWISSGSNWFYTTQSGYDNGNFNDSGGLAPLAPASWSVTFVYSTIADNVTDAAVVLSSQQYSSLTAAELAQPPANLPFNLSGLGLLVGSLIVQSGSFSPTIQSAYTTTFMPAPVTQHNSLLGLQGGTGGQYYHLTSGEYTGTGTGNFVRATGGNITATGSLFGTSSNAISASYSPWADYAKSASFASSSISSSYAVNATNALTSSFLNGPHTGSTFGTASWAINISSSGITGNISSSNIIGNIVATSSWATNAISSSFLNGSHTGSTFGTASWAANITSSGIVGNISSSNIVGNFSSSVIVGNFSSSNIVGNFSTSVIVGNLNATAATASFLNGPHTGSTFGTASWASNLAGTASWAANITSSGIVGNISSSTIVGNFSSSVIVGNFSTSVIIGNLNATASWAISSSWSPVPTSASWSSASLVTISASFASQSISASYSVTSSWSNVSSVATSASYASASSFNISSSWASQSLVSISSSFASSSLTTISASWSSASISSSYSITSSFLLGSIASATYAVSASWASSSISSSYGVSSSYALTASFLLGSVSSAIYATSASWASSSVSASFLNGSATASVWGTASWATNTITANTASFLNGPATASVWGTSSWASNISSSGVIGTVGSSVSSSFLNGSATASLFGTASWSTNALSANTSSFTSGPVTGSVWGTSSWATNALSSNTASFLNGPATGSIWGTASWASNITSSGITGNISSSNIVGNFSSSVIVGNFSSSNIVGNFSTSIIVGNLNATASWAANITSSGITGNISSSNIIGNLNATSSWATNTTSGSINATVTGPYYFDLSTGSTGGQPTYVSTGITFNTANNALSCSAISASTYFGSVWTGYNVKAFGAAGNGSTDDTSAIQLAISHSLSDPNPSTRSVDVFFPPGIYKVSAPISMSGNNVALIGSGIGSTVILNTATTGDILQIGNNTAGSTNVIELRHMQLYSSAARTSGSTININQANNVFIYDIGITNYYYGILIQNSSSAVRVDQGFINSGNPGSGSAIRIVNGPTSDTYISNLICTNTPTTKPLNGIEIVQTGGTFLFKNDVSAFDYGLVLDPLANNIASFIFCDECLFDSCGLAGLYINPAGASTAEVASVRFQNAWFGGTTGTNTVNPSTNITGSSAYGIIITGSSGGIVDDISFVNCRVLNNYLDGVKLLYNGANNLSFIGCTVAGNGQSGSGVYNGFDIQPNFSNFGINDCVIGTAGTATNTQKYAINFPSSSASSSFIIKGNNISNNNTAPFLNIGAITGSPVIAANIGDMSSGIGRYVMAGPAAATTTATETMLFTAKIPANSVRVGQTFRISGVGTNSSTGSMLFRVRAGVNGTTADSMSWSSVTSSAATTTNTRAGFNLLGTVRSLTSFNCDGMAYYSSSLINSTLAAATITIAPTAVWYIDVSAQTNTGSFTLQECAIEAL